MGTEHEGGTIERQGTRGSLLSDRSLADLIEEGALASPRGPEALVAELQPSSLDLSLGAWAARVRASFLPAGAPIEERLAELETDRVALRGAGAVLERGRVYLIPLQERLSLPERIGARFNPRSSTGRCDVFARVLVPGHPRYDEAPPGYRGPLWLEVAPLSFPVRLAEGDRLAQLRLQQGSAALTDDELRAEHERTPLCHDADGPVPGQRVRFDGQGGLALHLGLEGRDPAGWRARTDSAPVHFARPGAHDPREFWEPLHTASEGHAILAPGRFHLFASRERIVVPPHLCAEMEPVDVGLGEMRNNYAGFFDNGFGWTGPSSRGTPAVLEVRAHDVPFLVEEGQVFFRLRYFRCDRTPNRLYAQGREDQSYARQDLTLARCFRGKTT